MPKVSVIVPVYNGEAHLRECLDSIKNQSLTDMEIICVDDGSSDASPDILKEYAKEDARFQIYQQAHKYAGVARNLGKSYAKGEYLAFWDCDDFFEPQALEKLYEKAKQVDADVCVCGGNQFLDQEGEVYPWPSYLNKKLVPKEDPFNRFSSPKYYLNFTNGAAWNKLFKRSYIEELSLDFQPVRNGNDVYFTENAIGLAEKITTVNERLVNYRVNQNGGLVTSLSRSPLSPIQAWIDIGENLEKHEGFGEQSFANKAIGSMLYLLRNLKEWEAFRQAVEALQSYGLKKMHILSQEGYYYNDWHEECVRELYEDTPEEFAVFLAFSSYKQKNEETVRRRESEKKRKDTEKQNNRLQKEMEKMRNSRSYRFAKTVGRLGRRDKN